MAITIQETIDTLSDFENRDGYYRNCAAQLVGNLIRQSPSARVYLAQAIDMWAKDQKVRKTDKIM